MKNSQIEEGPFHFPANSIFQLIENARYSAEHWEEGRKKRKKEEKNNFLINKHLGKK